MNQHNSHLHECESQDKYKDKGNKKQKQTNKKKRGISRHLES